MLQLQQLIGLLLIILAHADYCPIFFDPPEVVVKYEASFSVNCSTNMTDNFGLSWEGYNDIDLIPAEISERRSVMDWEMQLTCYIETNKTKCSQNLPLIIYKTPDSVSISTVNHNGPMMAGNQYELQCDVLNVAPVQYLTVKWYKGQTLVNQTNFTGTIKTPVSKTSKLLIRPDRADDGAQYRCEAELELGEEGPQPPPKVSSDPLNITVYYYCPIFFDPPEVVVKYEASFSVNCSTNMTDNFGLSWEGYNDIDLIPAEISERRSVMDWEMQLTCYIDTNKTKCSQNLPLIIYKTPDSVSISTVNHNGPMMAGNQYELQCDVLNVAPVQNLTVKWYKGQTLVNQTTFTDTIKTPVNKTSKLLIRPDRADDGAQYWCEAELQLGEEGPQPPPKVSSDPLSITLYYGKCPVQLIPQRVVVRYNSSVSVDCKTYVPHVGMGWEASEGEVPMNSSVSLITWRVSNLTEWEIQPFCHINLNDPDNPQCLSDLPVTVYKTPDSVSISTVNHNGPMMEGNQYELQCDVLNVAPVQNLTVKWYKGQTLVNQITFTGTIKTPVNKTSKLLIRPDRADDGAQYRCEAELELGEEGPQPPPKVTSDPLSITVYFKPIINETKLPSTVHVFRGYPVGLVCEAEGNPKPTISWNFSPKDPIYSETLTITDSTPEDVYCIANNSVGNTTRHVKVSKQDGDCPVQLIPQRVVVRYNSSVSADCKTYVPHVGMGWEASEGAVGMNPSVSLITWRVSNLTEWDIKPSCFINYNDDQCLSDLPVTLYKTPDSVSISTVNHNGPMMEGNQYELQCDVLNVAPVQYLTVKWYKGQTLVNQTTFTDTIKTPVSKTSKLLMRPDRADDGAQYRCEAELQLGEEGPQPPPKVSSDPLNITVYYKPQIKHCQDWFPTTGTSLVSYTNSSSLVGNPRPNISWRRKSSLVNASILLNTNDSDQYEITASNELGDSKCILNITVQYPPKLNCRENYKVKANTPFQLSCPADGLPKPDVSLYKNGKIIQLPYYPTWNDSGWYQLTATNRHGTVNSTFFLNILYAPVFSISQDMFVVVEDSNITLECHSLGNPEPKMWWSFKNKNISIGRRHIIERATSTRAGVYTCSATNEFGSKEKTFVVEIKDNSTNYILIVAVILALLVLIIAVLFICAWKKKKSTGSYLVQPVHQREMVPLNNGGKC